MRARRSGPSGAPGRNPSSTSSRKRNEGRAPGGVAHVGDGPYREQPDHDVGHGQVGPHRGRPLAPGQDLVEQGRQQVEAGAGRAPGRCLGGGPPAAGCGHAAAHELEDRLAVGHLGQHRLGDLAVAPLGLVDHGLEQLGLLGEAPVERAHADVGPLGDGLHGGAVALLGEDQAGGVEDAGQVDLGVAAQRAARRRWPRTGSRRLLGHVGDGAHDGLALGGEAGVGLAPHRRLGPARSG